jgi:hypothetical protein
MRIVAVRNMPVRILAVCLLPMQIRAAEVRALQMLALLRRLGVLSVQVRAVARHWRLNLDDRIEWQPPKQLISPSIRNC